MKSGSFRARSFASAVATAALLLAFVMPGSAGAVTLKIATLATDGTTWMKLVRGGADEITKRTQGRVTFRFYPGGVMGSDKSVRRKIRVGQLQGGVMTGGILFDVYPDSQLYSMPLAFSNYKDVDYVRKHMDKRIMAGVEKGGLVTFGISEGGFAYIMSKEPIRSIDDLRKTKVWVPEGDVITRTMFETAGVTPIPLPLGDVYTGLQTGLVTTVGTSPVGAIALQWYTQVKYVTDVPLMYIFGVLAVDKKAFYRIAPGDRKIVREVMERVFAQMNRDTRADNRKAKEALHKQGLKFVTLPPSEMKRLRKIVNEARVKLGKMGYYTPKMYAAMERYVEKSHRKQGLAAH
ncbi:MAG: TRAP transporter substrate-binding protein DctP [Acidiferrobacteraceae bacterium]|jgi:TRAP-type C4-dicarboxylate transport system substrate-binding protein